MYHPGKVMRVFSPKDKDIIAADENLHALVEMWDENIFTVIVDAKISQKIKEGDVVIIDYYPISAQSPVPKRVVTKILRGKHAEYLWNAYKTYHRRQATIKESMHEHTEHNEYMD
jgi:hypothetical protein